MNGSRGASARLKVLASQRKGVSCEHLQPTGSRPGMDLMGHPDDGLRPDRRRPGFRLVRQAETDALAVGRN